MFMVEITEIWLLRDVLQVVHQMPQLTVCGAAGVSVLERTNLRVTSTNSVLTVQ